MPFSDYIADNIATRGVARPLAAVADYYMASRQPAPALAPALSPEDLSDPKMGYPLTPQQEALYAYASPKRVVQLTPEDLFDPNMGYPLTPQQEAMYAQASPRRVMQLTPEELAQYNIPNATVAAPQQVQRLTPQEMAKYNLANAPVDTSYSGSGVDFGPEQSMQTQPVVAPVVQSELAQEAAPIYPEREHELRRQDLRAKMLATNELMISLIQRNDPSQAETIRSIFKDRLEKIIDPEQMKSFSDLPEGKAAFERVKELNTAASKSAKLLSNQLKTFDNYMAAGDTEGARQYAVQSITRTLQSLTGQDAEQMSEFLRRSEALLSVPEILRQTGSNSWTKDSIGILLSRLQKGDAELIAANPERWAQFAKSAVNDYAKTYNEAIQSDIIDKTSPDFARRIPGSDFMKTFDVLGLEPVSTASTSTQQSPKKTSPASSSPKVIRYELKNGELMRIQD